MPRFISLAILLLLTVVRCVTPARAQADAPATIETITRKLASAEFAGRAGQTDGGRNAGQYLASALRDAGLKPVPNPGQNVAGLLEGTTRKGEFVIVSAHYDGFGGAFVGAMDNAAGVAVMLDVARLLAKSPPQRSVLFLALAGGEQGNAGLKAYAERPLVPLEKTVAVLNFSGFGGGFGDRLHETLYAIGAENVPALAQAITKHKRSEAYVALIGDDVTHFLGGEHFHVRLNQLPVVTFTNGVHYAYHTKADTVSRINFAALPKHGATLAKIVAEIANTPGNLERIAQPQYDADEAAEWSRLLTALRENVIQTPANNAGLAKLDDALLELKRFKGVPVQDAKARTAVILRAASLCFYIANPNGVEFNSLLSAARNAEQSGNRAQAIAAYQKLLKFIEDEYRRDDQTVNDFRAKLMQFRER